MGWRTAFALILGTMIPITFFVLRSSVGTSWRAKATERTPTAPSTAAAREILRSAATYFVTRSDRSVFARSRTRKNSTMRASRFSLRRRWPRSAMRRVLRSWRSTDRVGLYAARTMGSRCPGGRLRRWRRDRRRRLRSPRGVVLLQGLAVELREPALVEGGEELPAELQGVLDAAVLLAALAGE